MSTLHTATEALQGAHALPALFISHGSPMTALDRGAAGRFMRELGPRLLSTWGRPRAVLVVSAHSLARSLTLLAAPRHEAIYDFGGFDPKLRTLRYDAPGAPELAAEVAQRLGAQGWDLQVQATGGLDHGIWTPLRHAFPQADIPVLPLAWNPRMTPAELMRLGQDLAYFADRGVLVVASGSITHNLNLFMRNPLPMEAPERTESSAFRAWWAQRSEAADWPALQAWQTLAPHGPLMHPTDEHLLPYFVTAGVAQARGQAAQRWHEGAQHGVIGMDAYAVLPANPESTPAAKEAVPH